MLRRPTETVILFRALFKIKSLKTNSLFTISVKKAIACIACTSNPHRKSEKIRLSKKKFSCYMISRDYFSSHFFIITNKNSVSCISCSLKFIDLLTPLFCLFELFEIQKTFFFFSSFKNSINIFVKKLKKFVQLRKKSSASILWRLISLSDQIYIYNFHRSSVLEVENEIILRNNLKMFSCHYIFNNNLSLTQICFKNIFNFLKSVSIALSNSVIRAKKV